MSRYREQDDIGTAQPVPGEKYGANEKNDTYRNDADEVKVTGGENVVPHEEETIRALKPRQISMIAIGGAIGAYRSRA